ncbi:hypothetical protein QQF64_011804 [Cirrhinus molitorella]|uniref:Uncharacterized protein n=1 Tax=Cirrhinus molitorella TaxID=172907 RepID=A0ABR3LX29_9TELE
MHLLLNNTIPGHTAAKRPPAALRRLEIKLRPAGEVGRNGEHRAWTIPKTNILHSCFHIRCKDADWRTEKGIVGVSLMHVFWVHFRSMSSHRGNTGQGQPAQV